MNDNDEQMIVSTNEAKSGLEYVSDLNETYVNGIKQCMQESIMTAGLALGATAVYYFGIEKVLKFLNITILLLGKLIHQAMVIFGELLVNLKKEVAEIEAEMESSIDNNNSENINEAVYDNTPVSIIGWAMNYDIDGMIARLANDNYGAADAHYFDRLNNGEDIFETHDQVLDLVASNRARIMNVPSVSSKMNTVEFADVLKRVVFGPERVQITLTYKEAKQLNKINKAKTDHLYNLLKAAMNEAREGLKALDRKRIEIQRNPSVSTQAIKKNFQVQLNWLIQYRTARMKDQILIFETLIKYVKMVNVQTKVICAKALEL